MYVLFNVFSTLTTKKVRLIYERETSQVLNSEEKRQLKEIIVKLLPDFLSHQSPRVKAFTIKVLRFLWILFIKKTSLEFIVKGTCD